MRSVITAFGLLALTALTTHAQTPAPTYDARFVLTSGDVYEGTTTFAVNAKGAVTGRMTLTAPTPVNATLTGTLEDGVWSFKYAYSAPEQGCSGTVEGTAKVPTKK